MSGGLDQSLPHGFVRLRDVAPSILEDVRYAGSDNFTGAPVPGYEKPECWLLAPVAEALAAVARDAHGEGYGLVVWDAYRPQRASDHFLRWAQGSGPCDPVLRSRFHPRIDRRDLFEQGYLSRRSSHSQGAAVDLGLVDASGAPVDFGAPFDFFDPLSATDCPGAPAHARASRSLLRRLMEARGFRNYAAEYWHYGYPVAADSPFHDKPIR